ncbi:MAG: hypothetical protein Q4D81_05075 [Eubacteriales bacterium]|nr:hypothetical protein [Eubacteriales bacterium]
MFKITPILPDATIEDPRADLKKAVTVEQFKAGEEAVFFPDGFDWEYLPYREVKAVIRAKSLDSTDRWLVKYAVEKPSIRLLFRDSYRLMIMDKNRNADMLAGLLKDYRDAARDAD